jgi:hypothetical protein
LTTPMTAKLHNLTAMNVSDPLTMPEIDALALSGRRPLIICDVDEVIFHFLDGLENHLAQNECWLDPASFALTGNIRHSSTNEPVSQTRVGELLFGFFDRRAHNLKPIKGAQQELQSLAGSCDIVLLTNIPRDYLDPRKQNLKNEGFDYPIVINRGGKGQAVSRLNQNGGRPTFFLDDSPANIESVSVSAPETILIHFMQDQRFRKVMPPLPQAGLQAKTWTQTRTFIDDAIEQELSRTDGR